MRRATGNGWNTAFLPNSKINIKSLFLDKNEKTGDNKRNKKIKLKKASYLDVKLFANVRI